ncbi:hypothetical protein B0H67DRAFT_84753 [Lasiosphaeris hirsuta]|uniref:Uncharacterized protein n=1 Tax=Lasiosphaeris hirsuta TaxID=260670 RepID=A0AA40BCG0_9PEZI|nr:hypothetical protein B0H67DRAFT_84753 [Lasiosphaeris hirsuta]
MHGQTLTELALNSLFLSPLLPASSSAAASAIEISQAAIAIAKVIKVQWLREKGNIATLGDKIRRDREVLSICFSDLHSSQSAKYTTATTLEIRSISGDISRSSEQRHAEVISHFHSATSPRPCNNPRCKSDCAKSISLQYCFPKWFLLTGVHVTTSWLSLKGQRASLHLQIPPIIERYHGIQHHTRWGN